MLAPSAFLTSAAATLPLQEAILSPTKQSSNNYEDLAITESLKVWHTMTDAKEPLDTCRHVQRAWDEQIVDTAFQRLLSTQSLPVDQARLKAVSDTHTGDWLNALPLTAIGLRLSDEDIRVAVAYRLGAIACQPHICECGSLVDARGLHGLSCRKSAARQSRHSQLNDIIWRAVKRAQVPASKEPLGLSRTDGKRPDGATLIPWARGKPLAWDVTVPDTYAASHLERTSRIAGAAAEIAATNKMNKYITLMSTHHFVPIAIETGGAWCPAAIEFIQDLGRKITEVTDDPMETTYLFQRISIAIQRGNSLAFHNAFASCSNNFSPTVP